VLELRTTHEAVAEPRVFQYYLNPLSQTYCHTAASNMVFRWCRLPNEESRQVVAPRQETTTGAAGASEPLCIAQGAAASVPKFPRPHPHSITHSPFRLTTRPPSLNPSAASPAGTQSPALRTTYNAQTPRCLLYASPSGPPIPQAREAIPLLSMPAPRH
jgi:hypothetical protein